LAVCVVQPKAIEMRVGSTDNIIPPADVVRRHRLVGLVVAAVTIASLPCSTSAQSAYGQQSPTLTTPGALLVDLGGTQPAPANESHATGYYDTWYIGSWTYTSQTRFGVSLLNGFQPKAGDKFDFIRYGSASGPSTPFAFQLPALSNPAWSWRYGLVQSNVYAGYSGFLRLEVVGTSDVVSLLSAGSGTNYGTVVTTGSSPAYTSNVLSLPDGAASGYVNIGGTMPSANHGSAPVSVLIDVDVSAAERSAFLASLTKAVGSPDVTIFAAGSPEFDGAAALVGSGNWTAMLRFGSLPAGAAPGSLTFGWDFAGATTAEMSRIVVVPEPAVIAAFALISLRLLSRSHGVASADRQSPTANTERRGTTASIH
jgi:hypothetical protein